MNNFKNKTVLVTGGTGSFGTKFIEKLLKVNNTKNNYFFKGWSKTVSFVRKIEQI